ncbi:hypothetical protein ACIBQ6_48505 [Nonomuraea sp. NPDC049655]|uniref:hypothetical protein n=1 Tax=Nonomuraea sp. NPDC049655 TaxID=3364355 RepID=UPI0037A10331
MTDPDRHRTGQPEVDALLDQADAAHQAVAEIVTIHHAERIVSQARLAELVAEHEALHERYQQAEAKLTHRRVGRRRPGPGRQRPPNSR